MARRRRRRRLPRHAIAARIRTRAGERLNSAALVADGNHARVDGFVSLGVLVSAAVVGLRLPIAEPIIGLAITVVILHITWQSWRTIAPALPTTSTGTKTRRPREARASFRPGT